jgi:hypothetical protein
MTSPKCHSQRGSAALLGLLFGLAMIAVLCAVTSLTTIHMRSAARHRQQAQARAAAESGVAACMSALAGGRQVGQLSGAVSGRPYRVQCSQQGSTFTIESTGSAPAETGFSLDCLIRLNGRLEAGRPRYTACSVHTVTRRGER